MEELTTPTLTLSGLGSARKASVTPRMGSFGACSTWPHQEDMRRMPAAAMANLAGARERAIGAPATMAAEGGGGLDW